PPPVGPRERGGVDDPGRPVHAARLAPRPRIGPHRPARQREPVVVPRPEPGHVTRPPPPRCGREGGPPVAHHHLDRPRRHRRPHHQLHVNRPPTRTGARILRGPQPPPAGSMPRRSAPAGRRGTRRAGLPPTPGR